MREASISKKSGSHTKSPIGASFAKDSKPSNSGNARDIKDVECFKCHKKGHYANKCPDAKEKDGKGYFKARQLDRRVKMKKKQSKRRINPSDRSESVILTAILVVKILSYVTGSRYMIYRGLSVTLLILAI